MSIFRISPYVQSMDIDKHTTLVGHPFFLESGVLGSDASSILRALRERASTIEELQQKLSLPLELVRHAIEFFQVKHFVLEDDDDEVGTIKQHIHQIRQTNIDDNTVVGRGRIYRDYTPVNSELLRTRVPFAEMIDVKFLILGGCLTQFAADAIQQLSPSVGMRAQVEVEWPDRFESATNAKRFDVVIFQPSTTWILAPLWDDGPFLTDDERAVRLQFLKEHLRLSLNNVRGRAKESLLLVQGFSTPTYSPLGRSEFRRPHNYYQMVYELNQVIVDTIKNDPNAMLIDEESLLSAAGKSQLMDHSISTFSHHAPLDFLCGPTPEGPSREETFGIARACHAPRLFAQAYLDSFVMWSGIGQIKCVIVDLDNILWPGTAGEGGFNIADYVAYQTFNYGIFGGIHQALKIITQRGILLAVCSRNHEAVVTKAWQDLEAFATENGLTHVLWREDFVIQRVNWERKSANIAAIMTKLGLSADAVIFIDDSAIEREEVQTAFPNIRTLGSNLNLVRTALLNDPCLQNHNPTPESTRRTDTIRAQLQRDAALTETVDEQVFLRGLEIRLTVTKVRSVARLSRMVELMERTNQFNTSMARFSANELRECIDDFHEAPCTFST